MQVSYEWLSEFIDLTDITPEDIAHNLTMSGLEVEEIEVQKPKFTNIITAKILKIDNHPNADKLHLVTVDIGNTTRTVVCGAQNIKEGQIIPYASVGSKVFSRKTGELFELTPAQITQLVSDGVFGLLIENNNATFTAKAIGAAPTTTMTVQITRTETN